MNKAATRQLSTPDARRPIASEIHEQKKRPATAARLTQIASFEASGAVIPNTTADRRFAAVWGPSAEFGALAPSDHEIYWYGYFRHPAGARCRK